MSNAESPRNATPVGHLGARVDITERPVLAINGWFGVLALAVCVGGMILAGLNSPKWLWLPILVFVLIATSLVIVPPGQTSVVQFFGRYIGTARRSGFWWVAPLTVRRRVSIRVRNFETGHLKVNDADGNPVEIAAIVVWQVADTAKSTYAVDNFVDFISVQAESALRHVAVSHPYDDTTGAGTSLRGSTDVVAGELARRWPNGSPSPASKSSRCGSPTWRTPRRSRRRCCGASRPTPWWPLARASSKGRSAWSRWRSAGSTKEASSPSTRSAQPAWSAT